MFRSMMQGAGILAMGLAVAPGIASAAGQTCLTPNEFSSLASYALPSVINGTAKRCSTSLKPDAFLRQSGTDLAQRYSTRKSQNWPGAKAAFLKLSGSTDPAANKLFKDMPDESLKQMLDPLLEGMVAQEIPLEKCATIDTFVRLLAPLPPENTAELIAVTVGLASKAGDQKPKVGKFTLCES